MAPFTLAAHTYGHSSTSVSYVKRAGHRGKNKKELATAATNKRSGLKSVPTAGSSHICPLVTHKLVSGQHPLHCQCSPSLSPVTPYVLVCYPIHTPSLRLGLFSITAYILYSPLVFPLTTPFVVGSTSSLGLHLDPCCTGSYG